MEYHTKQLMLHPEFLEQLFAFKSKVTNVFRDVLGIHEINHIAITRVNKYNQLMALSSTPAMEFNLFTSSLWQHDQTYNPRWFNQGTQAYWQTLYQKTRYDELYYIKQIKHNLPLALSLAAKLGEDSVIYSMASHKFCSHTRELFATQQEDFYKIGQYCSNLLNPLFSTFDYPSQELAIQDEYETSK